MTATPTTQNTRPPVTVTDQGACGLIVLDRPEAANAINEAMREAIFPHYDRWPRDPMNYAIVMRARPGARAFCAGGDVRELARLAATDLASARASLAREYAHNWKLQYLQRPHVALIDGAVMGSGVGLTIYGTHRIAGPNYRFAMPECAIGFVPDIGASWFLSRLPDQIGTYLALTARTIGRADAYRLDLVTHCLDTAQFDPVIADLAQAEPIDPVLDSRHLDPGTGELEPYREAIAHCFGGDTVNTIIDRLTFEVAPRDRPWADGVLADLKRMAPVSLHLSLALLRLGALDELDQALKREYRAAVHLLTRPDFASGVQAMFVDRARAALWHPSDIAGVERAEIDALLSPFAEGELDLPRPPAPPSALA